MQFSQIPTSSVKCQYILLGALFSEAFQYCLSLRQEYKFHTHTTFQTENKSELCNE